MKTNFKNQTNLSYHRLFICQGLSSVFSVKNFTRLKKYYILLKNKYFSTKKQRDFPQSENLSGLSNSFKLISNTLGKKLNF